MGGEEIGSGVAEAVRNGRVGMSCLGVVTLLIVISEEAPATKGGVARTKARPVCTPLRAETITRC